MQDRQGGSFFSRINLRLLIAIGVAVFSLIAYLSKSSYNPITEEKQHIDISPTQEIALGMQSVPEMENQYGGPARD
jgi:beta-barrel assembly-enhancing protease